MSSRTFLDIDDTILTKTLLLPENNSEQEINDTLGEFETISDYVIVHPSPAACIKIKLNTNEKVFINICTSYKIPPPEDITEEEFLLRLKEDNFPLDIPMNIGEERLEVDKGGIPCIIYDCIINTYYIEKCKYKPKVWLFTIFTVLNLIAHKFGRYLDINGCIILKNRKVMGTLKPQRINKILLQPIASSSPKILSSSKTACDNITTSVQSQNNYEEPNTCDYVILKEPSEGITNRLIGLFQIPKGVSSKDLIVLVDPSSLVVTNNESKFLYNICVPYIMKTDEIEGFFDKDLRVLRLNMPVYKK